MSFISLDSGSGGTPPTVSLAGFNINNWNTLNAGVGTGPSAVVILVSTGPTANPTIGWRQTGQTGFTATSTIGANHQCYGVVGLQSGQFDLYLSATTGVTVYVYGTLGPEYVPITPVDLTALTGSYQNYNVTSQTAQNAIAVALQINNGAGVGFRYGASGASTDAFNTANGTSVLNNYIIGLDPSQNFQGVSGNGQTPILLGYWTAGISWHINAVNVTPGTAGSFQNLTPAAGDTSPLGFIFDNTSTAGTYTYSLSEQGSGLALAQSPVGGWHGMAIGANPAQINMSTITTTTLYERGYFTSFTPSSYSLHSHLEF